MADERQKQIARLTVDLQELERAIVLLRLNKNFGWTYHLVDFLHHIIELLQAEGPQPQPEKPAGQDIGAPDFGAHSPR